MQLQTKKSHLTNTLQQEQKEPPSPGDELETAINTVLTATREMKHQLQTTALVQVSPHPFPLLLSFHSSSFLPSNSSHKPPPSSPSVLTKRWASKAHIMWQKHTHVTTLQVQDDDHCLSVGRMAEKLYVLAMGSAELPVVWPNLFIFLVTEVSRVKLQ